MLGGIGEGGLDLEQEDGIREEEEYALHRVVRSSGK